MELAVLRLRFAAAASVYKPDYCLFTQSRPDWRLNAQEGCVTLCDATLPPLRVEADGSEKMNAPRHLDVTAKGLAPKNEGGRPHRPCLVPKRFRG
jgi:hypothetical protein